LRFEADNAAALKRIQQVFRKQLLAVDFKLKLPF
jgi:phosphomannomutase/phosphoglucomutase